MYLTFNLVLALQSKDGASSEEEVEWGARMVAMFLYLFGETAKLSKDGYYYYLVLLLVVGRLTRTPSLPAHSTFCTYYFRLLPNPEHTFLLSPYPLISLRIGKTKWRNGEKSDPLSLCNLQRVVSTETTGIAIWSMVALLG